MSNEAELFGRLFQKRSYIYSTKLRAFSFTRLSAVPTPPEHGPSLPHSFWGLKKKIAGSISFSDEAQM